MDHSWITSKAKMTQEYNHGVKCFMNIALLHNNGASEMVCHGIRCRNLYSHAVEIIRRHININSMCNSFTTWIFHGESISSNNEPPDETIMSDDLELVNASRHDNVGGLMEDLVYESRNFTVFFVLSFVWVHPVCLYHIL